MTHNDRHSTLWRHLHTLRALLPPPGAHPTRAASTVQLCGRRTRARRGWVRAGARSALARELASSSAGGHGERMIGESVRTWVNGTFRGVTARWLSAYVDEARIRWRVRSWTAPLLVERLLRVAPAFTFADVRAHFGAWR